MSKPKAIGYHASQRIDDAQMCLADITRMLRKLLEKNDLETAVIAGRALDKAHQAAQSLKEVRTLQQPERRE